MSPKEPNRAQRNPKEPKGAQRSPTEPKGTLRSPKEPRRTKKETSTFFRASQGVGYFPIIHGRLGHLWVLVGVS
jgi:hypothetical protein